MDEARKRQARISDSVKQGFEPMLNIQTAVVLDVAVY